MKDILIKTGFTQSMIESIEIGRAVFWQQEKSQPFFSSLSSMLTDVSIDAAVFTGRLTAQADASLLKNEMFYLVFYLENAKNLLSLYRQHNIAEHIYYDTIRDFTYKAIETFDLKGYFGIHCPGWYPQFFRLKLFASGRFQYAYGALEKPDYYLQNITVKKGSPVLCMHIPSSGSMDKEARLDSYKKAYSFYENLGYFTDGIMKITCNSWLFYPPYKKLFPPQSNLAQLIDEFDIIDQQEFSSFTDGWRIFGKHYNTANQNLPQTTSLQKRFVDYFNKDNPKYGSGYGILLFDGKNILQPNGK